MAIRVCSKDGIDQVPNQCGKECEINALAVTAVPRRQRNGYQEESRSGYFISRSSLSLWLNVVAARHQYGEDIFSWFLFTAMEHYIKGKNIAWHLPDIFHYNLSHD